MKRATLCLSVIMLAGALPAWADLTPEQTTQAEALIQQFSAREFAGRQQAVKKLIEMGPDVLPLVKKTLAETEDGEVKLRCGMVIRELAKRHAVATRSVVKRFGYEASRVTLKLRGADIEDVLEALAEQSGNALLARPQEWEDRPLTFEVTDVTYWQAIEVLCRTAGLTLDLDRRKGRLVLRSARGRIESRTCAGPAYFIIRPERRGNYHTPKKGENTRVYEVHFLWEDRLRIAAAEVTLKSAADPDGTPLPLHNPGSKDAWDANFPSGGSFGVIMKDLPAGLEFIRTLEGTLTLRQASGEARVRVKDVFAKKEHDAAAERLVVNVKVKVQPVSRWLTVRVRDTNRKDVVLAAPTDARYGFYLIGPGGGRHRPRNQLLGSWGVTECGHGGWFGANGAGDCINTRTLGFWHLPFARKGWTLLCVCPTGSTSHQIPFTLKNVPVPPPKTKEKPKP